MLDSIIKKLAIVLVLCGGIACLLYFTDLGALLNGEVEKKVEELKEQGYEWEYTGKQYWEDTGDNPAILLYSHKGTKPRYYWRIGELEERRVK